MYVVEKSVRDGFEPLSTDLGIARLPHAAETNLTMNVNAEVWVQLYDDEEILAGRIHKSKNEPVQRASRLSFHNGHFVKCILFAIFVS